MNRFPSALVVGLATLALAGCATRAVDVKPLPANPADFALWGCDRLHDEQTRVQQRATERSRLRNWPSSKGATRRCAV